MRTLFLAVTVAITGACYKQASVSPCTLTCDEAACPDGLVCGSDMLCQTPGMPLCSTITGDGSDGSIAPPGGLIVKAPNADMNDEFGTSVALSVDGVWLVVGAPGEASNATGIDGNQADNSLPEAGAVYVFKWDGTSYVFQTYLKSPSPDMGDRFGASVAIATNNNAIVVGAPFEDGNGVYPNGDPTNDGSTDAGAAFVFTRTTQGSPWMQTHYVKSFTNTMNGQFGTSVAIAPDASVIGVGAPGERAGYLMFFAATGYTVPVANAVVGDHVGSSVALQRAATSQSVLLVGANLEDGPGTGFTGNPALDTAPDSGAVYLGTQNGAVQLYGKASNTETGDQFGMAVAGNVDFEVYAVGAIGEDSGAVGANGDQSNNAAVDSGAVFIYARDHTALAAWNQSDYLKAPNTDAGDNFGRSLAVAGDGMFIVVGAPGEASGSHDGSDQTDNSAPRSGAVYGFANSGSGWQLRGYHKAFNGDPGDELGTSVAVSDDHSVVAAGAPHEASAVPAAPNDNTLANAGAVYVFR